MKKTFYIASAAVAMLAMASCTSNKKADNQAAQPVVEDVTEVYAGILPAADADGIQYTLVLEYEADDNFMEGDYNLTEVVLTADTTSTTGYAAGETMVSKGDFDVFTKDGGKYLKLTKDDSETDVMYFQVTSDSTIVMVNADLEQSVIPELNYTLTKK
ncbi:MAG: copper resistance protein NlpE N-terminal domain-containing protein [Muribaculaceae bacterium]|nr:copper resistance protein NlpE N-terminal domain-containing protein [Muribaculaceae bacterium]